MLRNGWPEWIGMTGRNGPEQVAGINRNQWPECVGIRMVKRKARMGRNPGTGEAIKIPAKTVVKMRIAKAAKEAIVPPKK